MPTTAARPVGQIAQHDADTLLTDASDSMGIGGHAEPAEAPSSQTGQR